MSRKEYERRQARIAAGRCPRCDRPVEFWMLKRVDVCSPKGWRCCIRDWRDIHAAEACLTVKD